MLLSLLLAPLLTGCATQQVSLVEVRGFADASASLGGYGELARRYRDTYDREQAYLAPGADKQARANDAKRKLVCNDFVSIQKTVVLYMQTLSALAGETRYDLGPRIDALGSGLTVHTDSAVTERHVTAYTGLVRLLTRVAASGYQNRSVAALVRDGDSDVQALLDAMLSLTRLYEKTFANEKKTVLGLFEIELPTTPRNTERLLMVLARVHYLNKSAEFKLLDKRYALAIQGLTRVAQGHQTLRDNLHQLTRDDIRLMLASYAGDLRQIHEGLAGN